MYLSSTYCFLIHLELCSGGNILIYEVEPVLEMYLIVNLKVQCKYQISTTMFMVR